MALVERLESVGYYDQDAARFAGLYDSVTFEAVHPMLSNHLPRHGRALDIGAGSGRDARAMASRGLTVTAVEPAPEFRRRGIEQGKDSIRWIDDRLPDLASLAGDPGQFDFILCSAVLMLVDGARLRQSLANMARLLASDGLLAISLRDPIPGEPLVIFHRHEDEAIIAAASAAGLICLERAQTADALGRDRYRWRTFVFGRHA